ncbi:MAG: hypothetical protein WBP64_17960 [Nitrososphaeraceae archaeon]
MILNAVNASSPELRYPVGKDAESVFKARTELTDKELEQWVWGKLYGKEGVRTSMILYTWQTKKVVIITGGSSRIVRASDEEHEVEKVKPL